jgi:hypothetical protein
MNKKWQWVAVAGVACGVLVGVPRVLSGPSGKKATTTSAVSQGTQPGKGAQSSAVKGGVAQTKVIQDKAPQAKAVQAKPLSKNVRDGLQWLVKAQHENGGWSQGEESVQMGGMRPTAQNAANGDSIRDTPNVADTCAAALALIRAGSTPAKGEHARNIRKALAFVCGQVEAADEKSLYITAMRGTRLQSKLGPYIDTFLASLLLAEAKGEMPDATSEKRVAAAFEKVMDKIEKNQKADGTWDSNGWAPVLAQSMASKAINRSVQKGARSNEAVRQRAETYARGQYDAASGSFGSGGSAGVPLYAGAANLGAMQDSDNTNQALEQQARAKLRSARTQTERQEAERTLKRIADNRSQLQKARTSIIGRLDDKEFIAGFGSNGGEEFLSHMYIGESLVAKGGAEWKKWDKSMTENLNRIQNQDGSWSGHHCITGRTFCTAAALMVLTVDRAPVPVASKFRRG